MKQPLTLRNKLLRLVAAAFALAVIAYFAFPYVGSYTQLAEKVKQVGAARVQGWAVSILDRPPALPGGGTNPLSAPVPITEFPDDLKPLTRGAAVAYQPPIPGKEIADCIRFEYGSWGSHYSLVVGRQDFHPKMQDDFQIDFVADGVWIIHPR